MGTFERALMFTREFVTDGRTNRITVKRDPRGWEVREERDNAVVRHMYYADWHRVERAIETFKLAEPRSVNVSES
jgi:hypothetical protein